MRHDGPRSVEAAHDAGDTLLVDAPRGLRGVELRPWEAVGDSQQVLEGIGGEGPHLDISAGSAVAVNASAKTMGCHRTSPPCDHGFSMPNSALVASPARAWVASRPRGPGRRAERGRRGRAPRRFRLTCAERPGRRSSRTAGPVSGRPPPPRRRGRSGRATRSRRPSEDG